VMDYAEEQLTRLRPMFPGWELWTVPLCGGRGWTWCARPAGVATATVNVESAEELIRALCEPVKDE